MSSSNSNAVNRVLIGDGANSGAVSHLSGIQKGDLLIIDENKNILATVAAAQALPRHERIYIAAGIGPGQAILSSPIQGNTISKYEGTTYVAPSEMVMTLGDATTGISVTAGEEYRLRILIKDYQRINGQRQTLPDIAYLAKTGDDEKTVASKIAILFNQKDFGHNFLEDKVKLERISDGTRAAFPVGANATVTKGSKQVSFAAAHSLSVGAIVKFQGISYLVAEVVSTTVIKLDVPYVGASETILVADADTGVYTVVSNWGFKLTGLPQEPLITRGANEFYGEYEWINFDAVFSTVDGLEVAPKTIVTKANPGQGYWKQVSQAEEMAKAYLGDTSKRRFYDRRIDSNVVKDETYNSIVIIHANLAQSDFERNVTTPLKTEIYIPDGGAQGDDTPGNNEFLAILNGFVSDVIGFAEITF